MDLKLRGKRALVTGSTSGIGAECARLLAIEGASVVITGRNAHRAKSLVHEIREAQGEAECVLGELDSERSAKFIVDAASEFFGGIDILVNNVGNPVGGSHASWFDASWEEWISDYRQNTLIAASLIHACAPQMKERGWGRFIQISSRNAISPHTLFPSYGAAKAALNNLTLSLSKELAGTGVTSNGIMPGLIYTPQLDNWFLETANRQGSTDPDIGKQFILNNTVQQTIDRLGQPFDIAAAVCFIASPLSDFMTGTTLRIDGGATPTV